MKKEEDFQKIAFNSTPKCGERDAKPPFTFAPSIGNACSPNSVKFCPAIKSQGTMLSRCIIIDGEHMTIQA